ncbi:hypothetical protein [Lacticaseibacillus suibinensis]|uniref:hypothetical protein n=1 Tax=Lacticaseibacillus suibinensis TaxID=2486011 RepID=UPI000F799680|nr:hypothetical protein [Lacticaseibacillus suibinensis]
MMTLIDGAVRDLPVGEAVVPAYMQQIARETVVNCIGLDDYLAVRGVASPSQRQALDDLVAAKLAAAAQGLLDSHAALPKQRDTRKWQASDLRQWQHARAAQITRNWLADFAADPAVPTAVRQAATLG